MDISTEYRSPEDAYARGGEQAMIDYVAGLQKEFWDALSGLESIIGCDIDGNNDLDGMTSEDLRAAESAIECTCDERSWHGDEHDTACPLTGVREDK